MVDIELRRLERKEKKKEEKEREAKEGPRPDSKVHTAWVGHSLVPGLATR